MKNLILLLLLCSGLLISTAFSAGFNQGNLGEGPNANMFQGDSYGSLSDAMRAYQSSRKAPSVMGRPLNFSDNLNKATGEDNTQKSFQAEFEVPPPAPNLFQSFVQKTTGVLLPIFGQTLFNRVNTFAEQQSAPIPADYVVGPGDELLLKIFGASVDIDQHVFVDRDGMIILPKVGPVSVAGIRMSELEKHLKHRISKVLSNFRLFVSMGQLRGIEVYIIGQARHPGKYVVGGLSTVISALFSTGGPSSTGSLRAIQLVRSGKVIATVDLYEFLTKGDSSKDRRLLSGDVINILPVGPMVALKGELPSPAIFELSRAPNATSLRDILSAAGGVAAQTAPQKLSLERLDPEKQKPLVVQTLALNEEGLKTPLKDGDILTFFPIKADFENAVALRILDEDIVRVPVTASTRIKDVLPTREAMLTSGYFLRRFGIICKPAELDTIRTSARAGLSNSQAVQNPSKIQNAPSGQSQAQSQMPAQNTGTPLPMNCFPASLDKDLSKEVGGENDISRIRRFNGIDQINWEHAIIERPNPMEFTTEIIPFNLGKAIAGDELSNLLLQPGDAITVFSQQDIAVPIERQTQIVRIQGEVKAPGVYQLQPGETLKALVARAGGVTANAYNYGTELSRQSVKVRQRENLNTIINRLEAQLSMESAKALAGATQTAEISQVSAINEQYTRSFQAKIERLKQMMPSGRISLEMDPSEPEFPDFKLTDGDEIKIPTEPGYVSVVGAVLNENVLIFHPGRKASNYLDVAGLAENAETHEIFIVRADGSIEPPSAKRAKVYPGDTIVVPEKFYKESGYSIFMKGLKDWTQVFFQLGLGAAAVHTLNK